MVLTKRRYTAEFKQGAIDLAMKSASVKAAAIELGIPPQSLHQWINDLKSKGPVSGLKGSSDTKSMFSLVEENRRLQKELRIVREEKEILKKAAAYFAQNHR